MVMSVSSVPYHASNQHATSASSNMRRISLDVARPSPSSSSTRPPSFRSIIPCKFFRSGCCLRGDQCHFSHDSNAQQQQQQALHTPVTATGSAYAENVDETAELSSEEGEIREHPSPSSVVGAKMLSASARSIGSLRHIDDSIPLAWTLTPAPSRVSQLRPQPAQPTVPEDSSVGQEQSQQVCKFFLRGMCAHDGNCRFSHDTSSALTTMRPGEASQRKASISSPRAPAARIQTHPSFMLPARQMSLDLPQSTTPVEQNPSSAEFVHQSMLGKGVSHSSLLDADPQMLLSTLPGPSISEQAAKNDRRISAHTSPSTSQRRPSVSHADKGNMNYAAAVSSSSISSIGQPSSKPSRGNEGSIFGDQLPPPTATSKGIAIRNHRYEAPESLASQSVPLLSSSGSFFDMLSSEQDTFNYTRLHMSSGESNGSLIPADESPSSVSDNKSSIKRGNGAVNQQLPTRRVSFSGKPTVRSGMPNELTTVKGRKLFSPTHEQQDISNNSEVIGETSSTGNTWWSLTTPTPLASEHDQNNNNAAYFGNRNADTAAADADLGMEQLNLYFGSLAGTTDEDDITGLDRTFAAPPYNAMPTMMPEIFSGFDQNSAAACLAAAAAAAATFENVNHIPLLSDGSVDASAASDMLMNNDVSGTSRVIRGEVFYSPTPPHQFQQHLMHPFNSDAGAFYGVNEYPPMLNYDNIPSVGGGGVDDDSSGDIWHHEWQKKRLEGQPEMFPHGSQGGGMSRRVAVCRAGLAGRCFDKDCMYRHDLECEICGCEAIDPENPGEHMRECLASMEANMQLSFSIARSEHRECGICQEEIMESNRRFGLLPNCKHVFCLTCIRNWRDRKQQGYDKEAVRGCPVCRVKSDFVLPSQYFLDDDDEKQKVIERYQQEMKKIHCKYFNRGAGDCPFGDSCFYMHTDRRGQPITGLRPLFDSHTLLGCAFIEVEQGMTQRQRRQQRRQQQQQQPSLQQRTSRESTTGGGENNNNTGRMSSSSSSNSLASTATLQRLQQRDAQQLNSDAVENEEEHDSTIGHVGESVEHSEVAAGESSAVNADAKT